MANDRKGRGVFQEGNGLSIKKWMTACFLKHFEDRAKYVTKFDGEARVEALESPNAHQ